MVQQSRFMLALFAIALLAISFASADLVLTNTSATTANVEQGNSVSFNFKINNTNALETITNLVLVNSRDSIPFSFTKTDAVNNTTKDTSFSINTNLSTTPGVYNLEIKVSNGTNFSNVLNYQVTVTKSPIIEICGSSYAPENITFQDVDDDLDFEWMPLDDVELTINTIENKVDKDVKFDVSVLFYKNGIKVSDSKVAMDENNLISENFKIDGLDEDDVTLKFRVNGEIDEASYDAYVKIKGTTGCYAKKIATIVVEKDSNNVVVNDVIGPVSSSCGETVDLSVDVANIGSSDEDQVKVFLYNKELGVNLYKEILNVNEGDISTTTFSFPVPQNAVEKSYKFALSTEFEYDSDNEEYDSESSSSDDYIYTIGLSGNCIDATKPTVTAKLNSTAVVGEEFIVAVTFKNNGNTSLSAILAPEEYESWAELVSVNPSTITVGRAESKTVYMTFKPSQEGTQTFNLNAIYNGKSLDQPVTLSIDANSSLMSYLKEQLGSTGAYLAIGIAVLIALILLVAVIKLVIWLVRKH